MELEILSKSSHVNYSLTVVVHAKLVVKTDHITSSRNIIFKVAYHACYGKKRNNKQIQNTRVIRVVIHYNNVSWFYLFSPPFSCAFFN